MVLPFFAVLGSFLGTIITWIANPILYAKGQLPHWKPELNALDTAFSNHVDLYLSFGIGLALAVAIIGFYHVGASLIRRSARSLSLTSPLRNIKVKMGSLLRPPPGRGDIPFWAGIAIYLFSTTAYIVLCHFMVPEFPLWILIAYGFVYTPLISYVAARMEGIAGQWVDIPMVREATFIASHSAGYNGVGIWFAPIPINNYAGLVVDFRTQELTGTKFTSLIKAEAIIFPVVVISSILFSQYLWRIAPIPSAQYPFANKMWELHARQQALMQSSTLGSIRRRRQGVLRGHQVESHRQRHRHRRDRLCHPRGRRCATMLCYGLVRGLGTGIASGMFPQCSAPCSAAIISKNASAWPGGNTRPSCSPAFPAAWA